MKIILSPAKTLDMSYCNSCETLPLKYPSKTKELQQELNSLTKNKLGSILRIKGNLLDNTFDMLHKKNKQKGHAFYSYNGLVFKQLSIDSYREKEHEYIQNTVRILDALYGVLHPCNTITPYRLDMKAKRKESLYDFWDITPYFDKEETIINLASTEFSKMVKRNMVTIKFQEQKNDTFKTIATYAKQARGMMLDYMIKNQITSIEKIKQFNNDSYQFNNQLSTETTLVFTR